MSEDYEILEKIGHGSFGVIRKVQRKSDGQVLCRKEINYIRMSQKEREQLHAEFQILSSLRHPNIVAYYQREHLKASQDLHLYMEYCGNGDLGRVIRELKLKNKVATEEFVWSIFAQLVTALYRCHYGVDPPEVGMDFMGTGGQIKPPTVAGKTQVMILHRDLKPENVFLGEDNSVKLGDFGLSKIMHSHDFASTYVGTPFYMSPEICAAERYTLHSDIWALGCIVYELCAKEPPFNAKTHFHLVEKIKSGRFPPLPHFYSPELQGVIAKCLQVNPTKRPDTAQLLNMPVVKLMRKEREVVELGRALKSKEELALQKLKEWEDKLANIEAGKERLRYEVEEAVRREWEVKARLEIDRQVQLEVERLRKNYDIELLEKVEVETERRMQSFSMAKQPSLPDRKSDIPTSSVSTNGDTDFPSQTDLTSLSIGGFSVESPAPQHTQLQKKGSRTPFGRSQTMYVGSPMDVQMGEPSPMSIASLSLSPRRSSARFGSGRNIFAAAAEQKWAPSLLIPSDDEEEDENAPPSPTRQKSITGKSFKSPTRPNLLNQKALPQLPRPNSQHSFFALPKGPVTSFPSQADFRAPQTTNNEVLIEKKHTSPNRRLSRIPSSANLVAANDGGSPVRRPSKKAAFNPLTTNDDIHKVVTKNNMLKGRTLVELAQARAGGRPVSVLGTSGDNSAELTTARTNIAVKRQTMAGGEIKLASKMAEKEVAVWDPERDEMPSPFLHRGGKGVRRLLR
ncbi:hypothetical protein FGG08_005293 [Glutinoglossum americanum]|uniref:non-specific serine/threonine protein kinase n=1 Tax=Glutinoglossum americanum TaxID=1670608 RepID=A0A9P8L1J7_9PEZI|nr:hypothetical protein FGG08_005293 [Glutinoglossum americanum]